MDKSTSIDLSGVNRLIIIGGRVHSYVDIVIDTTQLSGTNGAGKTSTVNVLQFLYVADEKRWSLGRSLTETKDFYFPPAHAAFASTVFEVRTPTGPKLVIVRRPNGLLAELRYLVGNGGFRRDDFINAGGQPRKWDEVKLILSERGDIHDITEHRQLCLTGRGVEANLPNLGLVPLQNGNQGGYEKFATSFLNLLRLRDMDQGLLQSTLMDFAGIMDKQRTVDLAATLTEEINSIRKDAAKIDRLAKFEAVVTEARATYERLLTNGKWLNSAYPRILDARRSYDAEFPTRLKATQLLVAAAKEELLSISNERRTLSGQRTPFAVENGEIEKKLAQLKLDETTFEGFDRTAEAQSLDGITLEARTVRGRIAKAADNSIDELKDDIEDIEAQVTRLTSDIESHSNLLVTWLRAKLSPQKLSTLAALIAPGHLRARLGAGADIRSEDELLAEVDALLALVRGENLSTGGIKLPLDIAAGGAEVKKLADVDALRANLKRATEKLERARRLLEDAERAAQLEAQATRLEANAQGIRNRIAQYDGMLQHRNERPLWEERVIQLKAVIENIDAQIDALDVRAETSGVRQNDASLKLRKLNEEKSSVGMRLTKVNPVDSVIDPPETEEQVTETELVPLIDAWEGRLPAYRADKNAWESARANIETNLSDLYASNASPRTMLRSLTDEIRALEDRRRFTNNRMQAALVSAGSEFKGLMNALNSLTKNVRRIQRAFSEVKISGIESVRCEVERNKTECSRLDALIGLDTGLNLFDDARTVFEQFDRILHNRVYKLTDYFSVRLFIKPVGQPERGYSEFSDNAGSTGQVVMLKTLFNFLIIRSYLKSDAAVVPFFLDEVSTLDAKNFSVVVEFSRGMGFEGIYAAPLPSPVINRYYTIATTGDKLVIGAEQCQVLTPKKS